VSQDGSCSYNGVDFSQLNQASQVPTPFGVLNLVGCRGKQPAGCNIPAGGGETGSTEGSACLATNFTDPQTQQQEKNRPPVVCGSSDTPWPKYAVDFDDPMLTVGMIQGGGAACGPFVALDVLTSVSIAFECDKSATGMGTIQYVGFNNTICNFNVTWRTHVVCALPPAAGRPSADAVDSDWGNKCLVGFFVAVAVYCGGGTAIKSRLPNSSANCYNNVPNRDFWFELPKLVGDGCRFVLVRGCGRSGDIGEQTTLSSSDDEPDDDGPKE
jgi:hypothetical protein